MENYYYFLSLPLCVCVCATIAWQRGCVATVTRNTSKHLHAIHPALFLFISGSFAFASLVSGDAPLYATPLLFKLIVFRLSGGAIWMREERLIIRPAT